jgi:hypothetical protein
MFLCLVAMKEVAILFYLNAKLCSKYVSVPSRIWVLSLVREAARLLE